MKVVRIQEGTSEEISFPKMILKYIINYKRNMNMNVVYIRERTNFSTRIMWHNITALVATSSRL